MGPAEAGVRRALGVSLPYLRTNSQQTFQVIYPQLTRHPPSSYVYPAPYRHKMSQVWGVDVHHWWLPNDEGFDPILRQIRDFIEYRTTPPKDRTSERLREMAGIFETLKLDKLDAPSPPQGHRNVP